MSVRRLSFVLLVLLVLSLSAFADEQPYLVRDLPGVTLHDSMPYGRTFWTNVGDTTWFIAEIASKKIEIFKTDGTTAGTVQVTHGVGVPDSQSLGPFLGVVGGKLVYGGRDAGGEGVFALDTNGGDPVLLGRFQLVYLANGVVRGGALFFSGLANGEHELWRTGGTPETTVKVDLMPGADGAFNPSNNTALYSLGQWMLFYGVTAQGTGLHRTDGTPAGTTLVLPLSTSALFNNSSSATVLGDRLLFVLPLASNQLWATDGTSAGTSQIATLSSGFNAMGVANGQLFFNGGGIWMTDGTAAGTKHTDVLAGTNAIIHSGFAAGSRLFFVAEIFANGAWTTKLYVTEGTAASTHAIIPVDQHSFYYTSEGFAVGSNYYFRNDDGIHGMELWRTDGTTAEMVVDINPGYRDGVDEALVFERPDGKLLFAATEFNSGREPWITDGTAAGTRLLKNCAEEDSLNGSSPHLLRTAGDRLFFVAELAGGQAIGVSDGTANGTAATIVDFPWTIGNAAAANGRYFFSISTNGLYASDGSAAGTTPIFEKSATPYALSSGVVFSSGGDAWFSDGTAGGTRKLHTFVPFTSLRIFPAGSYAWLTQGTSLWKTDGTEAGTVQVVPSPAPTSGLYDALRSGPWTYFIESSSTPEHGYRLWRSDGSAAGTAMVKDFGPPQTPSAFVGATDRLVYFNVNATLYRSDGTAGGTIDLAIGSPCPASGAMIGDAFLFTSYVLTSNTLTVWRSDGTATGTTALATIKPPRSANVGAGCRTLTARGNAVYFSGWDAAHGWELWTSDGTVAGTKMVADIYAGTKNSLPDEMTVAGDRLFFSADSANIGRELWAIGGPSIIRRRAFRP